MTSITNKSAHSAVSASLKSADMSVIKNHSNMNESDLQAETIEIIPELPTFNDSEDDQFSEYEDDDETSAAIERRNPFNLNMMDDDDDEVEPFDEYGKYNFVHTSNRIELESTNNRCNLPYL